MVSLTKEALKKNVDKYIDDYLGSREQSKKEDIFRELVDTVKTGEGKQLFKTDKDFEGKIEAIARDVWDNGFQIVPKFWKVLYTQCDNNQIFQLFYITSLVNFSQIEEMEGFLKSEGKVSEIPKIIYEVEEMARLTGLWDYASLLLSRNGIYVESIYQKYAEKSTPVFTRLITENLRKYGNEKKVESFLSVLATVKPEDREIKIWYFQSMLKNREIQKLKISLKSFNYDRIDDEFLLEELGKLYFECGLYEDVLNLTSRVLSISSSNQSMIELRLKTLGNLGRDEETVDLFRENEGIIEKNDENLEIYFRSAFNIKYFQHPINLIESMESKSRKTYNILIWYVKFLILSGDRERAERAAADIPLDKIDDPEVLKIRALLRTERGSEKDFVDSSKKYIMANPDDISFLKDFSKKLISIGLFNELKSVMEIVRESSLDGVLRNYKAIALIRTSSVSMGCEEIKKIEPHEILYETMASLLLECRDERKFSELYESLGIKNDKFYPIFNILRSILFNNRINEDDFSAINTILGSDITGSLSLIYLDKEKGSNIPVSEKEKELREILEENRGERDIPEFLFPVISRLIKEKNLERAKKIIRNYDGNRDPFIMYYKSLISEIEGNEKESKRQISEAKNIFKSNLIMVEYIKKFGKEMELEELIKLMEDISKNQGLDLLDFTPFEYRIIGAPPEVSGNVIDLVEYGSLESISGLRLLRDYFENEKNMVEAIKYDRKIYSKKERDSNDILKYATHLRETNLIKEMEDLIGNVDDQNLEPESYAIFGDFFLSTEDYSSSVYYYEKAIQNGASVERCRGIIESLIKEKKFDVALNYALKLKVSTPYLAKIYVESNRPEELIKIIRKMDLRREADLRGYEVILDDYWNNRYVRKSMLEKFNEYPEEGIALKIATLLIEERNSEDAINVLRKVIREKSQTGKALAYSINLLCDYGKFEEALEYALKYFKSKEPVEKKRKIFTTMAENLVRYGYDDQVIKLYRDYTNLLDVESCVPVVKALINQEYYDSAEKILSRYQGEFSNRETFNDLLQILRKSRDFSVVVFYSGEYLKAAFKKGRMLDAREAIALGNVPVDSVNDVLNFINKKTNLSMFNQSYLEDESKKAINILYRKLKIERLEQINIYDLFYCTDFKDVKKAKAIYDYIQEQRNEGRTVYVERNSELLDMANRCIRENLPMNPIIYSLKFNIGIRKAMELKAFISNIDKVNN